MGRRNHPLHRARRSPAPGPTEAASQTTAASALTDGRFRRARREVSAGTGEKDGGMEDEGVEEKEEEGEAEEEVKGMEYDEDEESEDSTKKDGAKTRNGRKPRRIRRRR